MKPQDTKKRGWGEINVFTKAISDQQIIRGMQNRLRELNSEKKKGTVVFVGREKDVIYQGKVKQALGTTVYQGVKVLDRMAKE